ncbi:hypothetical protein [Streptomyces sp. NPDC053427]|uniref:hypothetical protein n=1 Tax=Streptomyces sp. NPDC053427 TaxID=3365701 RepID=UPI0037D0BB65
MQHGHVRPGAPGSCSVAAGDTSPLRDHFGPSHDGALPTLTATVLDGFIAETGFVLEAP